MKAFTIYDAHTEPPDFCWGIPGEIAVPPMVCGTAGCGCDRSHCGLNSHAASTTVMVQDLDLDFGDHIDACRAFLESAGWADHIGNPDDAAYSLATTCVEAAAVYPAGTVLRPTFDRGTQQWLYSEVEAVAS